MSFAITNALPEDDRFESGWGWVSNLEWCIKVKDAMANRKGVTCEVKRWEGPANQRFVAVYYTSRSEYKKAMQKIQQWEEMW